MTASDTAVMAQWTTGNSVVSGSVSMYSSRNSCLWPSQGKVKSSQVKSNQIKSAHPRCHGRHAEACAVNSSLAGRRLVDKERAPNGATRQAPGKIPKFRSSRHVGWRVRSDSIPDQTVSAAYSLRLIKRYPDHHAKAMQGRGTRGSSANSGRQPPVTAVTDKTRTRSLLLALSRLIINSARHQP